VVEISGEVKEWDAVEGMRNDFHQLSHVYRSSSAHFIRPKIRRVSTMTTSAHTRVIPVGRHGPHSRTRTFPSRFDQLALIREFVGKVVADVPLDNARAFDLKVAVSEASANAIEHGLGEGDLEVSTKRRRDRLTVTVSHPGAFRPRTGDDPRTPGSRDGPSPHAAAHQRADGELPQYWGNESIAVGVSRLVPRRGPAGHHHGIVVIMSRGTAERPPRSEFVQAEASRGHWRFFGFVG